MNDVRPLVLIDAEKLRNLQNNLKGFYDLSEECEAVKQELQKYKNTKVITPPLSKKMGGCEASQKQEENSCENKEISQKNKDDSDEDEVRGGGRRGGNRVRGGGGGGGRRGGIRGGNRRNKRRASFGDKQWLSVDNEEDCDNLGADPEFLSEPINVCDDVDAVSCILFNSFETFSYHTFHGELYFHSQTLQ